MSLVICGLIKWSLASEYWDLTLFQNNKAQFPQVKTGRNTQSIAPFLRRKKYSHSVELTGHFTDTSD
jgi:hypothetical protein